MRTRASQTKLASRLRKRVRRLPSSKDRGLTPSQLAYRRDKKKRDDYYAHEAKLWRFRPR